MWAFSDESERANVMLVAVVLVPTSAVEGARSMFEGLLLAGERRLHTAGGAPLHQIGVPILVPDEPSP